MRTTLARTLPLGSALLALTLATAPVAAQWTHWRGPLEEGTSPDTGLPEKWSKEGEGLAWTAPIGGRSTPVVSGDRLYLITRGGKGANAHELVVCLSAVDGKVLWDKKLPIFLTDIAWNRVGWTSPCADPETGNVYIHGTQGFLIAYSSDGKVVWQRSLTEEFGRFSGYGGRLNTPIIDEDLLIISFLNSSWGDHGRMWHRFLALDKKTGEARWWSVPGLPPLDTSYSCPVVAVVNGMRLFITGGGDGAVHALKVRTGEPVWRFGLSKRGLNSSVVVDGDRVYASHSEENLDSPTMGRVIAIDGTGQGDVTKSKELWRIDGLMAGYASPAFQAGRLFVVDNSANLACISAKDGKKLWEHNLGTVGKGSPVWADGKIYVGEVNSRFHVLKDGETGASSLDVEEFSSPDGTVVEINGSPAVAGGRVYFSTRDATYALGAKQLRPPSPPPASPAEPRADPAAQPAHLQIAPADVVLKPGESVKFRGRLFDSGGRFLRDADGLSWNMINLKGMLAGGELNVQPEVPFQAGVVEGKVGQLAAVARVRVIQPLPIHMDFEKLEAGKQLPAGWVGMLPTKFQVVELDGSKVLKKLGNNPLFARGDVYIGRPDWSGYTMQADVKGTYARRNVPDMGLICCRYLFTLTKNTQGGRVARIVAWVTTPPRIQKEAAFDWKPDIWYRMKIRVDPHGEAGVVRGKVWPRGDAEPREWTVEIEDPFPTLSGSPGLTAFSPGITERSEGPIAFFDNVEIAVSSDQ